MLRPRTRRLDWFDSYVETVVEREAPGITTSPLTGELPRLLRLVATRQAAVLNVAELARDARLPERSVYRYLDVLEAVFLVRRIPAWSPNLAQREVRAPKIVLTDPGMAVAAETGHTSVVQRGGVEPRALSLVAHRRLDR